MRKRTLKKGIAGAILMGCIGAGSILTYGATTYTDSESNNTVGEAQYIAYNAQTEAQAVANSNGVYRSVTGSLVKEDEDWYKVSLYRPTGDYYQENYLDISGGTGYIYIDIYNAQLEKISTFKYLKYSTDNVFKIDIEEDGVYYVRLYHPNNNLTDSYNFTIGRPKYKLGSYSYKFGSATLPAKGKWEKYINLSTISEIPNRAIGYQVGVGGCTTSVSSERYFYNQFYNDWVETKITYQYDLPVTKASLIDQKWGVKYVSSNSKRQTFNPSLIIYYVYPQLPQDEQ